MISHQSLYDILDVPCDATPDAIKAAFRAKALQYHPDQNSGAPESELLFRAIRNAFEVLSEPARRAEYDRFMRMGAVFGRPHSTTPDTVATRTIEDRVHHPPGVAVLGLVNTILWDLDDLVRAKPNWNSPIDGIPVCEHVATLLRFIDRWALETTGFPDHFYSARGLAPPTQRGEIQSASRPGHRPYVNVDDYFFNVRVRADRMLSKHRSLDLMERVPHTAVQLVDCILECHNYGVHYLGAIRAVLRGEAIHIPPFEHSSSCFAAEPRS
jgi:hypothetical protein